MRMPTESVARILNVSTQRWARIRTQPSRESSPPTLQATSTIYLLSSLQTPPPRQHGLCPSVLGRRNYVRRENPRYRSPLVSTPYEQRLPRSSAALAFPNTARRGSRFPLLRFVNRFPAQYRAQHFGCLELLGRGRGRVAVEDHKVGQHSGYQLAFFFLLELG